jgi:competence protein ComEC
MRTHEEAPGRRPPDLRLVPAALAVWAVVLLGLLLEPFGGGCAALLAGAVAVGVWLRRRSAAVMAMAACAAAAGVVITAQTMAVALHPLHDPAERGASATVRVEVRDDPRPVRAAGYGARPGGPTQVVVPATLVAAVAAGGSWEAGGRVLLLAPVEGWQGLLPGQSLTAEGLLAPAERSDLTVAVLRVRGSPHEVTAPPWWQAAAGALRSGLREAATAVLGPDEAGLLPGLAVGDTSRLGAEVDADFRASGLTHLLAVSGANLAILTGAVLGLLRLLRADPRLAAALGGVSMVGFVVLARPSPSVVRAAAMAAVVLLALGVGRARSALPALAAAVIALLLADPALGVDPGFALSVISTGALVLLAPGWAAGLRRRGLPGWVAEALAVPAAAFVLTAPVIAGLSGLVSPIAVLANLLVVPAVAPATVLGVLAALLSPVAAPLAQACAWLAGPAVAWLVIVADRAAEVPGAAIPWPEGVLGAVLLAGALVGLWWFGRSPRRRAVLLAVLLGLALVLVPTRIVPPGWPPAGWMAIACDVGQGDAIVLATQQPGWVVLIDTGPDPGLVDSCLHRLGVEGIAMVILSHLHADHVGGLAGAIRGRAVGAVAVGPVHEPAWALREVAAEAAAAAVPLLALTAGRHLEWPGLAVDVLGPQHPATVVDPEDGTAVNDSSLVLRAVTPAGSVLLPGDAELAAQADLLAAHLDLHADVLKMPHHGSRYTSAEFLAAVAPRAVLVSVGAGNRYGHPNVALLEALTSSGAAVRRTDTVGDVAVVTGAVVTGAGGARHDGLPDLGLVTRGHPLPAPNRRVKHSASDRRAPRAPPCWWPARWRSARSARPRRRGS